MESITEPEALTPEERLATIAAILAAGCRRRWSFTENRDKRLDATGGPAPPCQNGLTTRETEGACSR